MILFAIINQIPQKLNYENGKKRHIQINSKKSNGLLAFLETF